MAKRGHFTTLGLKVGRADAAKLSVGWALLRQPAPASSLPTDMVREAVFPSQSHAERARTMVDAIKVKADRDTPIKLFRWTPERFPDSPAAAEGATYDEYIRLIFDVSNQLRFAGYLVDFEDVERVESL